MPANLPPQYSKAEDEYRHAATPAERLEKLREMYRLLPKHKGTVPSPQQPGPEAATRSNTPNRVRRRLG